MKQSPNEQSARKRLRFGWILALGVVLYLVWAIYTANQTQVIDTDNGSMNMPGMERSSEIQITLTPMP